jgi:hypothetical protein
MLCGNPQMVREMRELLAARGLQPARKGDGQVHCESYW